MTGQSEPPPVEVDYIGPFEHHAVVLNGRKIPHVEAHPMPGGRVYLTGPLLAIEADLLEAEKWIPYLADCIARANGYVGWPPLGGDFVPVPLGQRFMSLDKLAGGDATPLLGHEHEDPDGQEDA